MKTDLEHRRDIALICKRMSDKGFICASDGNVSIRLSDTKILITPSGLNKGFIEEGDMVVTDREGNLLMGQLKPSSEIRLHIGIYKARPDVQSIIHAHPPVTVGFTVAGKTLAKCVLPEVVLTMGAIPTATYATPTTEETFKTIQSFIQQYNGIILDRHGTITYERDIFRAYDLLERIEYTAKVLLTAQQLGNVIPLTQAQIDRLNEVARSLGLQKVVSCEDCQFCGRKKEEPLPATVESKIIDRVLERLRQGK